MTVNEISTAAAIAGLALVVLVFAAQFLIKRSSTAYDFHLTLDRSVPLPTFQVVFRKIYSAFATVPGISSLDFVETNQRTDIGGDIVTVVSMCAYIKNQTHIETVEEALHSALHTHQVPIKRIQTLKHK